MSTLSFVEFLETRLVMLGPNFSLHSSYDQGNNQFALVHDNADGSFKVLLYKQSTKRLPTPFIGYKRVAIDGDTEQGYGRLSRSTEIHGTVYNTLPGRLIQQHYGNGRAAHSGVLLINHIIEGVNILQQIGADMYAQQAFCLHPLIQSDADYCSVASAPWFHSIDARVLLLAMEYRKCANAYLCRSYTDNWTIDGIHEAVQLCDYQVAQMLYADKVQNKKDFELYHKGTHPRSEQLTKYFDNWLEVLKEWQDYLI